MVIKGKTGNEKSSFFNCNKDAEKTIQQKLYLGTLLAMIIVLIPNVIMNYYLGVNQLGNQATVFLSIPALLFLYFLGRCKQYYNWIIVGIGVLIYLAIMWQNSSRGLYGTLPLIYIGSLLAVIGISKPQYHIHIVVIFLAQFFALIAIDEYFLKKEVVEYDTELSHNVDLTISYILTFLFSSWILRFYMLAYLQQHKKMKIQYAELKKANAMKNMYFTIMVHDLKGSFNNILGFTNLMSDSNQDFSIEQLRNMSGLTNTSARASYQLLEDILELSRIQQDEFKLKREQLNLRTCVQNILAKSQVSAQKKEIQLINNIKEDTQIKSDQYYVDTLLRNFINNAIKFTPQQGIITISAKKHQQSKLLITVKDTGIGMNQKLVDNLFKDDVKSNRSGTDGEPSNGIGLKICRELTIKSGNELLISSTPGKGSTFSFTATIA